MGRPMMDVTIAVIDNLSWMELRPYASSLVLSGFTGIKMILVTPYTPQEVRFNFTRLGFTLIEGEAPPKNPAQWDTWGWRRFAQAANVLRQYKDLRYVIWTDARDVIFQSDPSVWLEKNLAPAQMVVAGLNHFIKDCPTWNDAWLSVTSPKDYVRVREFEACACGTFAGAADAMIRMFEDINVMCTGTTHSNVTDQAAFNALVYTTHEEVTRVPKLQEGFSAQWWPAKSSEPRTFKTDGFPVFDTSEGIIYVPETKTPFCIVHLYDRDATWLGIMRRKYAE